MKPIAAIAPVIAALTLAACGDSAEDKAQDQVCDARADIAKQVDTLKNLTITTATTDQVQTSLKAIGDDLTKIKEAQGDLKGDRKSEVQEANQAFESEVTGIVSSLGSSTSLDDAKSKLGTAFDQLATSYQSAFSKIDC